MNLSKTAVLRPIGTGMLYLAVILVGFVAANRLAVDLMPAVDLPRISVTTRYEGVAPQEIETLLTRPIEQTVSTIQGIDRIEATSAEGMSRVELQFEWGTDLDEAVNDVRTALDRIRRRLPEDADPPSIWKFNLSDYPVAYLGLSGSGDVRRLRYQADETLSRRLERVPGVAAVEVRGGRIREIQVRLDAARLSALGITAPQVSQALARENRDVSAGDMLESQHEVVIRAAGEFRTLEDIGSTVVAYRRGRPIYVRDVATVEDTFQELNSELWVDREPGIRLRIAKQSGANTVDVVEYLRREVEQINREYAGRLQLTFLMDSSDFIKKAVTNVQTGAFYGGLLAIFILMLFLRNWRSTLVISTAIPISVLATFALMYFYGFTLNVISFGGLALGIGMLVDNAIVVLENIYRKRELRMPSEESAILGSREVAGAVVAGTLTTVAVFFPVVFIPGFAGIFFKEMAVVVCFALFCSLVIALTLVPMLSGRILQKNPGEARSSWQARLVQVGEKSLTFLEDIYGYIVRSALRRPWATVTLSVAILVFVLALAPGIPYELMPETDEGEIDVSIEFPIGTALERTMQIMKEVEARVLGLIKQDELMHITTVAGPEREWRPGSGNQGSMEVTLVPVSQRERSLPEIAAEVRRELSRTPGAEFQVRPGSSNILMRIMRGGDDRLSVEIRGHDLDTADRLGAQVADMMREISGVADVRLDREPGKLERLVFSDRNRLSELGLSGADVSEAVEHYVLGKVATRYREAGYEYDLRVLLRPEDRRHIQQLHGLPIITGDGRLVPLSSVAQIQETTGPTSITRLNQERILRVNAGLGNRPFGDVVEDIQAGLQEISVPSGFMLGIGGEYTEQQEIFADLLVGFLIAIFLVYVVMAVQFESLVHPLVIMTAVPFGFIGVVLTLLLTGTTFNMNSFLGTIILVGIMVNNSIVLVDYINLLRREHGMALYEALTEGARRRLRPVLMTTSTTVLAMMPLALGFGEGSEVQAPLARVIVGGLTTSTLITLAFVPCLYFLVERRRVPAMERSPQRVPEAVAVANPRS